LYGYLLATQTELGFTLLALVIALFVAMVCFMNAELALYINIFYSFFAYHISRYLFNDEFPVGIVTDILIGITLLSLVTRPLKIKADFNNFIRNTIIVWLIVIVLYHLLELFNPNAHSFEGWFQVFRRLLSASVFFFIAYCVLDDYKKIKRFITILFVFALIAALYGCIQQWHGLFEFEKAWVKSDEVRFTLMFIYGDYRKFSTMSDPAAFGMIMSACAVFFIVLAISSKKPLLRYGLLAGCVFMLLGMSYSGTRTAIAMTIGSLFIFILLTLNKASTKLFAFFMFFLFMFLMYVPIYNNATLIRFRTSFSGSNDQSYKVREMNRAHIQPYIYTHPFGGGLYTTGGAGAKYNPGHYLAGFPPDSGYLKKALETGWIGLLLIATFYFVVLRYAVRGYFQTQNSYYKPIYAASIALLFAFYIGEFSQEAIGQITDMVIYYPIIAIILRLRSFDEAKRQKLIKIDLLLNK
ncbi:MAG TPA: O-antigen ligase family protein, partial [Flavisolibacter sp.]|nr:O-antigen ligase family protein [Flavisolibacter sp.]